VSDTPLDLILRLGELDRALFSARRRRAQAEQISAPQELRVQQARRDLERLKEQAKTQAREATRVEGDAKGKTAEIEKTQVALNQAKSNAEYQALVRSIEQKRAELGDLETKILEGYEAVEARAAEQKALEARLAQLQGELAEAQKKVKSELQAIDAEVGTLEAERRGAAAAVAPEHLAIYQRVLEANKDSAIAQVANDICGGCSLKVRPEQVSQIRGKQIVTCADCSRILYLASP
jgi:predicted  nucleic acid-binding Zn-ribbon protein